MDRSDGGCGRHISIHSPHARGDGDKHTYMVVDWHFNPLPSCEGRQDPRKRLHLDWYFNPLPSCEGRHFELSDSAGDSHFNPLPSCEGRRLQAVSSRRAEPFQSTPLMRGETRVFRSGKQLPLISIHSPHARGDTLLVSCNNNGGYFNPLPSCEGRQYIRNNIDLAE